MQRQPSAGSALQRAALPSGRHDAILKEKAARLRERPPRPFESASGIARTALCAEPRDGRLHIFLPPSLVGVTHIAVQFPLYEQLKVYYSQSAKHESSRKQKAVPDGVT